MPGFPTRDPRHELNHSMPAAWRIKLGDTLVDIITSLNAIAAKMDLSGSRINATGTVTVGGSITAADTLTVTFTNPAIPALAAGVAVTAVAAGGSTTTSLAAALSAAVNLSAPLIGAGIVSTSTAAVQRLTMPGVVANSTTMTQAVSGSATETLTLTNAGVFAGGLGTVGSDNVATLAIKTLAQRLTS